MPRVGCRQRQLHEELDGRRELIVEDLPAGDGGREALAKKSVPGLHVRIIDVERTIAEEQASVSVRLPVRGSQGHDAPERIAADDRLGTRMGLVDKASCEDQVVQDRREPSYVELPRGYSLARLPITPALEGSTIRQSRLREDAELTILTLVERDASGQEHRLVPDPDVVLKRNQALVVLGKAEAIEAFRTQVATRA